MAKQVQFRRGTSTQNNAFTGAEGEITVDTTSDRLRVHDGVTQGGIEVARKDDVDAETAIYSASQAFLFASQAQVAALAAGAPIFLTVGDGIAGVADGDLFFVYSDGGVDLYTRSGAVATYEGNLFTSPFPTVAAAAAANIAVGVAFVRTHFYRAAFDDGGALYGRVATEPTHVGKFQSADGQWWEVKPENGTLTPMQLGAFRDGVTDDTDCFRACGDLADRVLIQNGTYIVRGWQLNGNNKTIEGVSQGAILKHPAVDLGGSASIVLRPWQGDNITVRGFTIDGNRQNIANAEPDNTECLDPNGLTNSLISNMRIINAFSEAIDVDNCTDTRVEFCICEGQGGNAVHISSGCVRVIVDSCVSIGGGLLGVRADFDTFQEVGLDGATKSGIYNCISVNGYRGATLNGTANTLENFKVYGCTDSAVATSGGGQHAINGLIIVDAGGVPMNLQVLTHVRGVRVYGAGFGMVFQAGAARSTLSDAYLSNLAAGAGITVGGADISLTNVEVEGGTNFGVVVDGDRPIVNGLTVRGAASNGLHIRSDDGQYTTIKVISSAASAVNLTATASGNTITNLHTQDSSSISYFDSGVNNKLNGGSSLRSGGSSAYRLAGTGGDIANATAKDAVGTSFDVFGTGTHNLTACRSISPGTRSYNITSNDNFLTACRSLTPGTAGIINTGTGNEISPAIS